MRTVLIVEDDQQTSAPLATLLQLKGFEPTVASTLAEARSAIDAEPDLVLLDLGLPDGNGLDFLRELRERPANINVVILTGETDVGVAVEAMRLGVLDYLVKPMSAQALEATLTRVGRVFASDAEKHRLRRQLANLGRFQGLVGRSKPMQHVYSLVERGAPSRLPIFIHGESGTGKEVIARAIHTLSPRRHRPFVALNCGAIPHNLVESVLFGHERGAFTGATGRRDGVFSQADGGTLFLDELAEMPMDLQVRLLRVIETGKVQRVGSTSEVPVDVRIVSATNRDPKTAVESGQLREDLYYRLFVFPIEVPPLRERPGDVRLLVSHFVSEATQHDPATAPQITEDVLKSLESHLWPGNVRELKNVVTRMILMGGERLEMEHLPAPLQRAVAPESNMIHLPIGITLAEAERVLVQRTLEHFGRRREKTARALGIAPKTLYNKCQAWGLGGAKSGR